MVDLNQLFADALSHATPNEQGEALLELLHVTLPKHVAFMSEVEKSPAYNAIEAVATILKRVTREAHPWLYGQVRGAWGELLHDIEHATNMADAIARERQWYAR